MQRLDPLQTFTCTLCSSDWSRPTVRGRTPRYCPTCRAGKGSKHIACCEWCGTVCLMRSDARGCSRLCGTALRDLRANGDEPVMTELAWQQCTACLCWRAQGGRHKYETCSEPCESIARGVFAPTPTLLPPVDCVACGTDFIPRRITDRYCSPRCNRKAHRRRRKAREYGSFTEWRWSDFMRMAASFNYCCAYCGTKPDRLDADHVIALAKHGPNSLSNLLPVCQDCNSDKSAQSLHEWAASRTARGLPPRATQWECTDPRYFHLTYALGNKTEGQAA